MMDSQYVHRRDMTAILSNLDDILRETSKECVENPEKEHEIREKLESILKTADRDIQLKTQTIVRDRMQNSVTIPFSLIDSTFKQKVKENRYKKTIFIKKVDKRENNSTPKLNFTSNINKDKVSLPILRSSTENAKTSLSPITKKSKNKRPQTAFSHSVKPVRMRLKCKLPKYDFHDPLSPSPELPKEAINDYGYYTLTDMKLVKEKDVQNKFDDMISVKPFNYDYTPTKTEFSQKYFLAPHSEGKTVSDSQKVAGLQLSNIPPPPQNEVSIRQSKRYIVFINGEPIVNSLEYVMFRRSYANMWEQLEILMPIIKRFCEKYIIRNAKVDIKAMIKACMRDPDELTDDKMWDMFIGIDMSKYIKNEKKSKKVGFGFFGPDAEKRAAVMIQSIWRGYISRRLLRNIRRNNAAARIIQRAFRISFTRRKFIALHEAETKRRISIYEAHNHDATLYDLDKPHFFIHLIEKDSPLEYGRLRTLSPTTGAVIFFFKAAVNEQIKSIFRKYSHNPEIIYFHSSRSKKIPSYFSIEDILSCDLNATSRIKALTNNFQGFLIPSKLSMATVELALKFNAAIMAPTFLRISIFKTRDAVRRLFTTAKVRVAIAGAEVYDLNSLCTNLTGLALNFPEYQQWVLRGNNGEIGWIDTSDMAIFENLRQSNEALDDKKVKNSAHLHDLIVQVLANDLIKILKHTGSMDNNTFMKNIWESGVTVEAGLMMTKSSPKVVFSSGVSGNSKILGSMDRLFISIYEAFACVTPSFTTELEVIINASMSIAEECTTKRLYGINSVTYYYAMVRDEDKFSFALHADSISLSKYEEILPIQIAELVGNTRYDPEKNQYENGMYFYVQERVILPAPIPFKILEKSCVSYGLPVNQKVFLLPSMFDESVIGLVVMEENVAAVITLALKVMRYISETLFKVRNTSKLYISEYVRAISYVKSQIIDVNDIQTTFVNKKVEYGNDDNEEINPVFGDGADFDEDQQLEAEDVLNKDGIENMCSTPNEKDDSESDDSNFDGAEDVIITSPLNVTSDTEENMND